MPHSTDSPLPPLRQDISGYHAMPGVVALYDEMSYSESVLHVPKDLLPYLEALDGKRSAEWAAEQAARAGAVFSVQEFLQAVETLDRYFFMESERFVEHRAAVDAEFNALRVRPAAFAGSSYPDDPVALRAVLDEYLASDSTDHSLHPDPVAVISPHIDPRVGGKSYAPAYNAIRNSTADTFIVLGVSHRMSYDDFMISEKDFDTPLGPVPCDRQFIAHFRSLLPFELTRDETAHRREHSIEFQAVFLRHIFPDKDIRMVPILPGSFFEYVELGSAQAAEDERLTVLYDALGRTARELGRSVCYIAGADLCHIGQKFGDRTPARTMFGTVNEFDRKLLQTIDHADSEGFLQELCKVRNRYRVCGVAPVYATLRASGATHGLTYGYDCWDEHERNSAVTFASAGLYKS